jgi:hypothetical protein
MNVTTSVVAIVEEHQVATDPSFYPFLFRRKMTDSEGINAEYTWRVRSEAIGKCKNPESPYLIANEWVSGCIGQFLRLPIPAFSLLRKKNRSTIMFASQSFEKDVTPDDLDPDALYSANPVLCAGIVIFDIFIANCDRNRTNIKVDDADDPTVVRLIDHERALFYVYPKEGLKRLRRIESQNRLGVTDGSESRDEWHCLLNLLDSWDNLIPWIQKVESIPDWFLDTICEEARRLTVTEAECNGLASFLKKRKSLLKDLIHQHRARFPKVTSWPLFL